MSITEIISFQEKQSQKYMHYLPDYTTMVFHQKIIDTFNLYFTGAGEIIPAHMARSIQPAQSTGKRNQVNLKLTL